MLFEEEQFEYNVMEKGMEHDKSRRTFKISYPFLQDPAIARAIDLTIIGGRLWPWPPAWRKGWPRRASWRSLGPRT